MTDEPPFPWSTYPLFFNGVMQMADKPMTLEERADRVADAIRCGDTGPIILAAMREVVAERDRKWQTAIGISTFSGPSDVHPAFEEATRLHVAKERRWTRERFDEIHDSVQRRRLLAALDAREKA